MKRLVWVILACVSAACSGGSQDVRPDDTSAAPRVKPQAGPEAKPDTSDASPAMVQDVGGGIVATTCKRKYPIKSWDDRESRYAFCERLGYQMASCTRRAKQVAELPWCEQMGEREERRMDILQACMSHEFDESQVPKMIEQLEYCRCGPQFATSGVCKFHGCREKIDCMLAAGFNWSPVEMDSGRY